MRVSVFCVLFIFHCAQPNAEREHSNHILPHWIFMIILTYYPMINSLFSWIMNVKLPKNKSLFVSFLPLSFNHVFLWHPIPSFESSTLPSSTFLVSSSFYFIGIRIYPFELHFSSLILFRSSLLLLRCFCLSVSSTSSRPISLFTHPVSFLPSIHPSQLSS